MKTKNRPIGFGDIRQAADFFGIPYRDVEKLATRGEWPSYVIGGKRVFNFDEVIDQLVEASSESREEATA